MMNAQKKLLGIVCMAVITLFGGVLLTACGVGEKKVDFKVEFMVDDAVYASVGTMGNEVIKMPPDPTKDNFIFDGWYWDNNDWKRPFTAKSLVNEPLKENMRVYAKWNDKNDILEGTQAKFNGFTKNTDTAYSIKIPNATPSIDLGDYVEVSNKSNWVLTGDMQGNDIIVSNMAALTVGDNTYYVLVTAENGSKKMYTLQIRRREIYTLQFNVKIMNYYTEQESADFEEDTVINLEDIELTKTYEHEGWIVNNNPVSFPLTVSGNMTLSSNGRYIQPFQYFVSNGKVTITRYRDIDTAVVIPETIDGLPVTVIERDAFSNRYATTAEKIRITEIVIPNSVISIGDYAFHDCVGLTSVTIGNSVTSIGSYAFYGCVDLTSIYFNAVNCADFTSTRNIFYGTGTNGSGIQVVFGDNVTKIPAYMFYTHMSDSSYRLKMTSVTIGNSVTSIGSYAFHYCTGLTSITIPNSVTSIGNYAFNGCTDLTSITVTAGNTKYKSVDNCVIEISSNALILGCKTSIIPNTVTSIGTYAFRGCTGLTSVTIPNSVISIGSSAFGGCTGLTSITIPDSVTTIGSSAFGGCTGLTSITIPDSVTTIGGSAFSGCTGLTSITIPDGVTSIGDYAFDGCTGLTSIYFNAINCADFNNLGNNVFTHAGTNGSGIQVVFGDNVTRIPAYMFYNCPKITSVTIGNSVTTIGSFAFSSCTGLTSIIIPDSVTSIGSHAFEGCTGLTIYAEAASKPSGWDYYWNYSNRPVYWAGQWHIDGTTGLPVAN